MSISRISHPGLTLAVKLYRNICGRGKSWQGPLFCRRSMRLWFGIGLGLCLPAAAIAQGASGGSAAELELGRRIYVQGVGSSGAELTGIRYGTTPVTGAAAACVHCHRPSGMGQVEGDVLVAPITGDFLFATPGNRRLATMDPHVSKLFNQTHAPYTDASLAASIIAGKDSGGRTMSPLMPRYDLSELELKALTAYLRQLSSQWSPGVSQNNIRFATVVTPDVDPARRKVFIDMMRSVFRQKNSSTTTAKQSNTRHHMTSAAEMILGTERKWDLDIWELQGAAETWGEQLGAHYRKQPVFAVLSGLSGSNWQPVHDFCDRERVPCWFPSVDVPGKSQSPYAFYFSGGVTLEAEVLARHLRERKKPATQVVQIYRDGDSGRAAAQALTHALAGSGITIADRVLKSDLAAADALRQALGTLKRGDTVMLWLRPDDIKALEQIKPATDESYFSAVLARAEHVPLPAQWRERALLVYPYELPGKRERNLENFHFWLKTRNIPLVDEAMQSEVFFALNFMTDTVSEMLDNLYRDYLVERAETMLNRREGIKAAQETRDRLALGREGDLQRKHGTSKSAFPARIPITAQQGSSHTSLGTTMYPRLSLAPEQRFASISGYIVRFAAGSGNQLLAVTELIVP